MSARDGTEYRVVWISRYDLLQSGSRRVTIRQSLAGAQSFAKWAESVNGEPKIEVRTVGPWTAT